MVGKTIAHWEWVRDNSNFDRIFRLHFTDGSTAEARFLTQIQGYNWLFSDELVQFSPRGDIQAPEANGANPKWQPGREFI